MRSSPPLRVLVVLVALFHLASSVSPSLRPPGPVQAGNVAGIAAAGASAITIINLDRSQVATAVVDLYKQGGGGPVSLVVPPVPSAGRAQLDLWDRRELTRGAYAAAVSSDRQIATLARTEWPTSGGAAVYNDAAPGTDVVVPLVVKGYMGQTSLITVQNTDPSAQATIEISLFGAGESVPVKQLQFAVLPGSSITLDLARDPSFIDVASGFLGAIRVASMSPVAVQSFVDVEISNAAVYAFEGIPAESAAAKLYAPVLHSRVPFVPEDPSAGARTTRIALMNPGATEVAITATFYGHGSDCVGQVYEQSGTIAAGSSLVLDQDQDTPGASPMPLPPNCAVSAVIEAVGGNVAGIVVDEVRQVVGMALLAGAYNLAVPDNVALKTVVPAWRKTFEGVTTGIYAMNAGTSDANATITFYDDDGAPISGCGAACSATIRPSFTHRWWPLDLGAVPDGATGHAVIESDGPLAVTASDDPVEPGWDMSLYNGVKADVDGMMMGTGYVPILSNGGRSPRRTPTPPTPDTPPPTPTLVPPPTPTPAPVPEVGLPPAIPARDGGRVRVPIKFEANGYDIGGMSFALDIDERWVSFDPADADGDGIPDSVRFSVPDGFTPAFRYDPVDTERELGVIVLQDQSGGPGLPDGTFVDFALGVGQRPPDRGAAVVFSAPPLFTDTANRQVPGRATGEAMWIPQAELVYAYLPFNWMQR